MRILALDLGDVWVGSALSDPLGIVCRPLKTIKRRDVSSFLDEVVVQYQVTTVLVGLPAGDGGQETEQSKKTKAFVDDCRRRFPALVWELLDEFLTSQLASGHQQSVKKQRLSAQSKFESHSLAAAFLLKDYLHSRIPVASEDTFDID